MSTESSDRRTRPKKRGKKDVFDEWEHLDIDRNEQKVMHKNRERKTKMDELDAIRAKKAERIAVSMAEKFNTHEIMRRPPNVLEEAWLRCDYLLYNMMTRKAYSFMDGLRLKDAKCYKYLYRIFMSPYMMEHANYWVKYFANGGKVQKRIDYAIVFKHYARYYGITPTIKIMHKGEEEKDISECLIDEDNE